MKKLIAIAILVSMMSIACEGYESSSVGCESVYDEGYDAAVQDTPVQIIEKEIETFVFDTDAELYIGELEQGNADLQSVIIGLRRNLIDERATSADALLRCEIDRLNGE